jgi:hypothetical protein
MLPLQTRSVLSHCRMTEFSAAQVSVRTPHCFLNLGLSNRQLGSGLCFCDQSVALPRVTWAVDPERGDWKCVTSHRRVWGSVYLGGSLRLFVLSQVKYLKSALT